MRLTNLLRKPEAHRPDAPVVEFQGVTVRYNNGKPALEDVSFALVRGERVAIVGPNGAGKTTLLKTIAGILEPTAGAVNVYGAGAGGHICIGYVPQRSQVDWNFPVTVADVVLMGRIARIGLFRYPGRHDRQLVTESLAQVGMLELADRQIGELSGGQQQRVFIARALAQEAELLLMDEPLTGLDVPAQEAIFNILDQLRARRMTVLVSTHDLQLATERFDRLMLLRRKMIGFGLPAEVLTPDNLRLAYGSHITMIAAPEGMLALGDTCCEGDEGHVYG
ncbi:MAG: metal ABC transporter ATP-binding protein [Anaerolineae bacterium]